MKDMYILLNDINIDENEFEEMEVNNIEKAKVKNNLKKAINKNNEWKKITVVAATIGVLIMSSIVIGIVNPSLADAMPSVKKLFVDLNNRLNLGCNSIQKTQDIRLSKTVNNITVGITVNNITVGIDGNSLYLTYIINSKYKPLTENIKGYELLIEIETGLELGLAPENPSSDENNLRGYYKDNNTFVGFSKYRIISEKQIPDEFNVKMNIIEMYSANTEGKDSIKGPWEFDFNVKKSIDANRVNLNKSQGEYKVNYVDITPFTLKLDLEFPKAFIAKDKSELKRIIIEDDKGQWLFRRHYTKDNIEKKSIIESTNIEDGIVSTNIVMDISDYFGYEKPKYITVKFVDYKNVIKNGEVIRHNEVKETKDIEFKVDLDM